MNEVRSALENGKNDKMNRFHGGTTVNTVPRHGGSQHGVLKKNLLHPPSLPASTLPSPSYFLY